MKFSGDFDPKPADITQVLSKSALQETAHFGVVSDVEQPDKDPIFQAVAERVNDAVPGDPLLDYNDLATQGSVRIETTNEVIAVGSSAIRSDTGLPARLFFGSMQPGSDKLACYGSVEGPHTQLFARSAPEITPPFVGYIETDPDLRRQGIAKNILPLLNDLALSVYGAPLAESSQLSDSGRALQEHIKKTYTIT